MIERLRVRIPAGATGEFSSLELTSCADSYSVSVPSPCYVKDPGLSAESAGGRLHLNTHTPLTQRSRGGLTMSLSRHSVGNISGNELTRNLSWNILPQSSQFAEPLRLDPGIKSGISVYELISTILTATPPPPKKKKHRHGSNGRTFPKNPRTREKKATIIANWCLDDQSVGCVASLRHRFERSILSKSVVCDTSCCQSCSNLRRTLSSTRVHLHRSALSPLSLQSRSASKDGGPLGCCHPEREHRHYRQVGHRFSSSSSSLFFFSLNFFSV